MLFRTPAFDHKNHSYTAATAHGTTDEESTASAGIPSAPYWLPIYRNGPNIHLVCCDRDASYFGAVMHVAVTGDVCKVKGGIADSVDDYLAMLHSYFSSMLFDGMYASCFPVIRASSACTPRRGVVRRFVPQVLIVASNSVLSAAERQYTCLCMAIYLSQTSRCQSICTQLRATTPRTFDQHPTLNLNLSPDAQNQASPRLRAAATARAS